MKETANIKRKDKEDAETEMETAAAARSPCKPYGTETVGHSDHKESNSENRGATLQVPVMLTLDPRKSMLCYGEQLPS